MSDNGHMSDAELAALEVDYATVPQTDCVICGGRTISMFLAGVCVCAAEHRKHQQGITDNHREASKQFPKDGDEHVIALLAEVRLLRAELQAAQAFIRRGILTCRDCNEPSTWIQRSIMGSGDRYWCDDHRAEGSRYEQESYNYREPFPNLHNREALALLAGLPKKKGEGTDGG